MTRGLRGRLVAGWMVLLSISPPPAPWAQPIAPEGPGASPQPLVGPIPAEPAAPAPFPDEPLPSAPLAPAPSLVPGPSLAPTPYRPYAVPERFAIEESLGLRGEPAAVPPLDLRPEDPRFWGGVSSVPEVRDDYLKTIDSLWIRRRELVERLDKLDKSERDPAQADELLDRVYEVKLESGQRNLFTVSAALVREARQAWADDDRQRARNLLSMAARLSPDLPSPHLQMADLLWREGPLSFAPALEQVLAGIDVALRSFREKVRLATSVGLLLMVTLLTLLMVLPAMLLLRHRRSIFHGLDHLKPPSLSRPVAHFLMAVAFLALAYLRIGPGWLILALLLLVWMPSDRWERAVAGTLWALFALTPVMLGFVVNLLGALSRSAQDPLVQAQADGFHPELRSRLIRAVESDPEDPALLAGLALVAKRGGHYEFAEKVLLAALDRDPDSARLRNNLANVLYWAGREAEAEAALREAIEIDPGLAEAHFNLSQILRRGFKLAEGQDEFIEARRLDARLVQDHTFTSAQTPNRFLIDSTIPDRVLASRLFPDPAARNADVAHLWSWIMKGLPWIAAGPVIGLIWVACLFRSLAPGRQPLFPPVCRRCGAPICARCGTVPKEEAECESCLALAVGSPVLDPLFKRDKIRGLRRTRRIRKALAWGLSVLAPGSGQVLEGAPVAGMLAMLAFWLLVFKLVFWNGFVNPQVVVVSGPSGLLLAVPAIAILVLYAAVHVHLSYLRGRNEE